MIKSGTRGALAMGWKRKGNGWAGGAAGTNREPIGSFSCFSPVLAGGGPQRHMFLRINALHKKRLSEYSFPCPQTPAKKRLAMHLLCEDKGVFKT
jgi:hypothetical protein